MAHSFGDLFITGGWVMWPLLIFSILTWAIVLERTFVLLSLRPKLKTLAGSVRQAVQSGDVDSAKQLCQSQKPHLSELFLGTLEKKHSMDFAQRLTDRNRIRLANYLKRNLWILGTIGSTSPFLGLFGTVVGIIRAFFEMAEQGAGGFSVVAGGISEALVATAAGLIVAIIALLAYNVLLTAANQIATNTKLTLEELLDYTFEKATA